jgi:DGQHR domain-containing protein
MAQTYKLNVLITKQGNHELICFSMKAKELVKIVDINKRDPSTDKGYQRVLSSSRVQAIAKYIDSGRVLPTSILVSLEKPVKLSPDRSKIIIPAGKKVGWVIDGQHRLAGGNEAVTEIEFIVVAFLNLNIEEQIRQFMTINNESKGVPTSLIYDLLSYMPPNKTAADVAKEQAAEIAKILSRDEASPFYGRIAIVHSPKKGEISMVNFVRKIAPLITRDRGKFGRYSLEDQKRIIDNYFKAYMHVFPDQSEPSSSIIYQTLGFGAVINVLDVVFDYSIKMTQGFAVNDIIKILKYVEDEDLNDWKSYGSGSAAEILAGNDFKTKIELRIASGTDQEGRIRL